MNNFDKAIAEETFQVDGKTYSVQELLMVDETNISEAFATQAGRYAYIAAIAAQAEALYNEAKNNCERVYADTELAYRDELATSGVKTTEAMIKAYVVGDKTYIKAQTDENNALRDWKIMKALADGLRSRGDMLISLGATMRAEIDMTSMNLKARMTELKS